jgi:hypothetical protein
MNEKKHVMEFYPEVIFTIPRTAGGSCCLKSVPKQTERSRKMYKFAKHLHWQNKDRIDFMIPSKSESRIRVIIKIQKFMARLRMWRLGIHQLPALVYDNKVLCQGEQSLKDIGLTY